MDCWRNIQELQPMEVEYSPSAEAGAVAVGSEGGFMEVLPAGKLVKAVLMREEIPKERQPRKVRLFCLFNRVRVECPSWGLSNF
ncbi:hypothetical protein HanIR_Chr16g0808031 [Helianthus annuus]|nr:hypothetical protein HanIR_Chr16g0808031 [Helianthus annuus]